MTSSRNSTTRCLALAIEFSIQFRCISFADAPLWFPYSRRHEHCCGALSALALSFQFVPVALHLCGPELGGNFVSLSQQDLGRFLLEFSFRHRDRLFFFLQISFSPFRFALFGGNLVLNSTFRVGALGLSNDDFRSMVFLVRLYLSLAFFRIRLLVDDRINNVLDFFQIIVVFQQRRKILLSLVENLQHSSSPTSIFFAQDVIECSGGQVDLFHRSLANRTREFSSTREFTVDTGITELMPASNRSIRLQT
mmetsp:Transcript_9857/g.29300  ORF Transcript_9857/g.29300 Transcript_9857/m.29300 type:complete len:251 (+) Transcript_9857:133-885(+)